MLCLLTLPSLEVFPHFSKACKSLGGSFAVVKTSENSQYINEFQRIIANIRISLATLATQTYLRSDYSERLPTEQRRLHNRENTVACINNTAIPELLLAKNCTLLILTVIPKTLKEDLVLQPVQPYNLCMLLLPSALYRSYIKEENPSKALLIDMSGH